MAWKRLRLALAVLAFGLAAGSTNARADSGCPWVYTGEGVGTCGNFAGNSCERCGYYCGNTIYWWNMCSVE